MLQYKNSKRLGLLTKEIKMIEKAIYLKADTINGVQVIDIYDEEKSEEIEIMSADLFYNSLKDLDESDVIYGVFDAASEDIFNKIKDEYGIN